jgi:hypothetical protein
MRFFSICGVPWSATILKERLSPDCRLSKHRPQADAAFITSPALSLRAFPPLAVWNEGICVYALSADQESGGFLTAGWVNGSLENAA